jgi:hypothetical protein
MSLIKDLFTSDSGASYIAMPIPKNGQKMRPRITTPLC